jgi:hypothetical protein
MAERCRETEDAGCCSKEKMNAGFRCFKGHLIEKVKTVTPVV